MEFLYSSLIQPDGYAPKHDIIGTERAIKKLKDFFEKRLAEELNLTRVSAPIFVRCSTGINDNLNGIERPVAFDAKAIDDSDVEIVQSLAKWKRIALKRYGFQVGEGLYTDMNAIRRDEELDNLHSIYVDQWDWEKVIEKNNRTENNLRTTVKSIYKVFTDTEEYINGIYPSIHRILPKEITFITSQELEDMYPKLTSKERENAIAKKMGAVFISQIGTTLASGEKHDGRSPDYDDWKLNGDIILWYPVLNRAVELSSMGIRVDEEALARQLKISGCEERRELEYHSMLLNGTLPYTIGGGIGQSRICMFFLRKAHIGEVQAALWPKEMIEVCESSNILLL